MGYTRRTGIPNDRVIREAEIKGYEVEELFMEKFHVCERVVIEYDLERSSEKKG